MRQRADRAPLRVLIAGGGVAALEAALGVRALAEERVEIELLAPEPHFWYRPLAVVEPFGIGRVHGVELVELAGAIDATVNLGALASVAPEEHLVRSSDGAVFEYDVLLVASGAKPVAAIEGALTFRGPADSEAFQRLLAELESGGVRHVVFAVPGGVTWPLPLYELALLTSTFLLGCDTGGVELALVTPEAAPLHVFGQPASTAVARLLAERGVSVVARTYPVAAESGWLRVTPGDGMPADRIVALPRIEGAPIDGLPRDAHGFIPTDTHGRVNGVDDVFAAGDVTTFPIKQGGLAAQQAQASAEAIAAMAGADLVPKPFRPVLRGLLLTGTQPRYLRAELAGGAGETSVVHPGPLWWPPGKVVGKYLAPFLADRAGVVLSPADEDGVAVSVDLTSALAS